MTGIATSVFGLACLFVLIATLPPVAARLRLPGSVLLALLGCGLGLALVPGAASLDVAMPEGVLAGLRSLKLAPEAFLAIFLPVLLFEASLGVDVRGLRDDIGPVLVLAVLAVVVTTAVAGLAVHLASDAALVACLLLGAVIATTDPVAVIQVFKEVGAPRRLSGLVEGESLLNDAAAIALYGLFMGALLGGAGASVGAALGGFAWDFLGGTVLGAATGRLGCLVLGRLDGTGPAEVTFSLALAYLTYALGDHFLGVSGVVAVVAAGLAFGQGGRNRVGAAAWQRLAAVWQQLSFWAASLIFVLAAMFVPALLGRASWRDLGLLAVLVIAATAARALILYAVLPLITRLTGTDPVQMPYRHVMLWGGLRGAVTLALALAAGETAGLSPDVRHLVTVLAAGYVLFTLFVQATTLRPLLRALGLDRLPPMEALVRGRALVLARYEVELERQRQAQALDVALPPVPPPAPPPDEAITAQAAGQGAQINAALVTLTQRELELAREAQARQVGSRRVIARLIQDASALLDAVRLRGAVAWRYRARSQLRFDRWTRLCARLHRLTGLGRPLAAALADRFEAMMLRRALLEELRGFAQARLAGLFDPPIAEAVLQLVDERREEVERALAALRLQYPEYGRLLATRLVDRAAQRREAEAYARMLDEGLLPPRVHQELEADLQRRRATTERLPPLDLALDVGRMLARVPLLAGLDDASREELRAMLTTRLALPEERIIRRGEAGEAMYFIASGAVEVVLPGHRPRLGSGDFFGEIALVRRSPRVADVVALGFCELLELNATSFDRFLARHPELRRTIEVEARRRISLVG